jgi:hypothetical protein
MLAAWVAIAERAAHKPPVRLSRILPLPEQLLEKAMNRFVEDPAEYRDKRESTAEIGSADEENTAPPQDAGPGSG